jgi:hypothetical protein
MKIERLDPAIRLSWQKKDEMKHFVSTEMGAQSFFYPQNEQSPSCGQLGWL